MEENAMNMAPPPSTDCVNIQDELYNLNTGTNAGNPTQQVQAAVQIAFQNYITYLECAGQLTDGNGLLPQCRAHGDSSRYLCGPYRVSRCAGHLGSQSQARARSSRENLIRN